MQDFKQRNNDAHKERLHKVIANSGVTSRRKAEDLILEGKVSVNGEVIKSLGFKVDPRKDTIMVEGNVIDPQRDEKIYVVLNKPRGYITTCYDPEGRQTVLDLCRDIPQKIFPVGRLDYYSEGLLLLTNDGDLSNKIIHPRYNITKVYEVKVFGIMNDRIMKALRSGILIDNKLVKPKSVRIIKQLPKKTWLEFRLLEGKNREIRRFCEAHGLTVDKLVRVAIEGLSIDGIPPGKYRIISKKALLMKLGMDPEGMKVERTHDGLGYKSPKKTIRTNTRSFSREHRRDNALPADDKNFIKFRKNYYQKTMEHKKKVEEERDVYGQEEGEKNWNIKEDHPSHPSHPSHYSHQTHHSHHNHHSNNSQRPKRSRFRNEDENISRPRRSFGGKRSGNRSVPTSGEAGGTPGSSGLKKRPFKGRKKVFKGPRYNEK